MDVLVKSAQNQDLRDDFLGFMEIDDGNAFKKKITKPWKL